MTTRTPKTKAKKPLSTTHKEAIQIAVANGDPNLISKALAQANNTPARYNQKITDAHLELILTRIAAGELLLTICEDLGVSTALVRGKAMNDRDGFGAALNMAKMVAADHSFDQQMVVAYDMTIEPAHKKLILDVLRDRAKVHNRAVYGDKIAVDHRAVVVNISPDDLGLC